MIILVLETCIDNFPSPEHMIAGCEIAIKQTVDLFEQWK
jgi:hypothetical protein